jgi:hypothetical protein
MLDMVTHRHEMRAKLIHVLSLLTKSPPPGDVVSIAPPQVGDGEGEVSDGLPSAT